MDLYEILDIDSSATETDIKKAYVKKLRQFPPDQFPEEFKQIRQAFETLKDPKSRNEYDTMSEYGEEIEHHLQKGLAAAEQADYETAIHHYKKILLIEPKINNVRNYYALALYYSGENNKALTQYQKLLQLEPNNSLYHYNMGAVLENLERYDEAVDYMKQACRLDAENIDAVFDLVDLLHKIDRSEEARQTIGQVIKTRKEEDFSTFVYLFKLLQLEVFDKNVKGIESTLKQIERLIEIHPDEKLYVAERYSKFAYELFEYKLYKWAVFLTERAVQLDPDNEAIRKLHAATAENKPVYEEYELLREDADISEWVRKSYAVFLFGDEVSEEEFETYDEKAFENLYMAAKYEPDSIIRSIRRMIVNYPHLYEQRKEYLQKFLDVAKEYQEMDSQYNKLKSDPDIVNALKRLAALLITDNISQEERDQYFEDIMDELSNSYTKDIIHSLVKLKKDYVRLYQLNTTLFDGLLSDAREHDRQHNSTSSTSSVNRSSGSSTSSSSSCFVATAAYGSPLVEELDVLRLWRDKVLSKSFTGRAFIHVYYRIGPVLASIVARSEGLKRSVRLIVYRILRRLERNYDVATMHPNQRERK